MKKKLSVTEESKKRIVLLDSHAILHRAFHAVPDFSSSKGEPTGALYGLVSMLLKLVQDLKPDYVVACRDLPGDTYRHAKLESYKATRAKTDDQLVWQLERAPEVFRAFGIPVYEAPGFEADDCLGTIVHQLKERPEYQVIIASGDMDALQLVRRQEVTVYTLRKGLNDTVLYDEAAVVERFGFPPTRIPDYKGLAGDTSDNIKGVKGIGEKTATDLVSRFGTIENIYQALGGGILDATERTRKLLLEGKADALLSKEIATIHHEAPIKFEVPKSEWRLADHVSSIEELCDRYEFRSHKERIRTLTGVKAPAQEVNEVSEEEASTTEESRAREEEEAAVLLWLLHSDITSPTREDIEKYTGLRDIQAAHTKLLNEVRETGHLAEVYEKIEEPLIAIVERMGVDGVAIDAGYLKKLSKEYTAELSKIAGQIFHAVGHEFNINSPRQLGVVLYDELKLSLPRQKKTPTGARTTREEELRKMADQHPIIEQVLVFRELQKLLSTYIDKLPALVKEDGRLHPRFLQAGSSTGRMASENPGVQNIPIKTDYGKRIRHAFVAKPGNLLAVLDYSQIELRIAAALSGDQKLVAVFQEGRDIHTAVAAQVFKVPPEHVDYEMRRRAKVINFGILYGMGVNALRENLGKGVSRDEASRFLDDYFTTFSRLAEYLEEVKRSAEATGFTETLFGRRRYFPGFSSTLPGIRAQAERMAINAPIQGTAADVIKLAMIATDSLIEKKKWRDDVRLVLQVHDELVYEVSEKKAEEVTKRIRETMEGVLIKEMPSVPLVAEGAYGKDWGSAKK